MAIGECTTSRERVLTPRKIALRIFRAIAPKEPDRVPADGFFRPEVWARLKQHFGFAGENRAGNRTADFPSGET